MASWLHEGGDGMSLTAISAGLKPLSGDPQCPVTKTGPPASVFVPNGWGVWGG